MATPTVPTSTVPSFNAIPYWDSHGVEGEEWLKIRQHGIHYADEKHPDYLPVTVTGSFVAKTMGEDPYQSTLSAWREKRGEKVKFPVEKISKAEIFSLGHRLEGFVAEQFLLKMHMEGVKDIEVFEDSTMYQSKRFPHYLADIDRKIMVNGKLGILECKTTSSTSAWTKYWKEGICPPWYEWQVRFYMLVCDVDYAYICGIQNLGSLDDTAVILIERNKEIEDKMIAAIEYFVDCCYTGETPEVWDSFARPLQDYFVEEYGVIPEDAPSLELTHTVENEMLFDNISALLNRKEELEKALEDTEEQITRLALDVAKMTGGQTASLSMRLSPDEVAFVKLKQSLTLLGFDEEAFRAEHPDLAEKYSKSKLDVATLKKKEKDIAKKYVLPRKAKVTSGNDPIFSLGKVKVVNIPEAI